MDKFLKRKVSIEEPLKCDSSSNSKKPHLEINLDDLPSDPGLRRKILDYHPNDRDKIRMAYLQKGPCQPFDHDFPQKKLEIFIADLFHLGLRNMAIGWSTVLQKMLHFVYVVIFIGQILEIKQVVILLLLMGLVIGKKRKDFRIT